VFLEGESRKDLEAAGRVAEAETDGVAEVGEVVFEVGFAPAVEAEPEPEVAVEVEVDEAQEPELVSLAAVLADLQHLVYDCFLSYSRTFHGTPS
jgi:hypothetical protein